MTQTVWIYPTDGKDPTKYENVVDCVHYPNGVCAIAVWDGKDLTTYERRGRILRVRDNAYNQTFG